MKTLSLTLFLLISLSGFAQGDFALGLKGGVNLQQFHFEGFDGRQVYEDVKAGDRDIGYHAGAFGRAVLGPVLIQPELVFTHILQTAHAHGSQGQGEDQSLNISFNRFDMPLLLGAKMGPFMLAAGPVGSVNFESKDDVFNKSINDFTWGYQVAAGIIIKKVTLDVRYENAFNETASDIIINNTPYTTDVRISQLIISLSIDML